MFQAIFRETRRPSKEMQMTIGQQLGLDINTVANFFMNARRRGTERFRDQTGGSSMAASPSDMSVLGDSVPSMSGPIGHGGKSTTCNGSATGASLANVLHLSSMHGGDSSHLLPSMHDGLGPLGMSSGGGGYHQEHHHHQHHSSSSAAQQHQQHLQNLQAQHHSLNLGDLTGCLHDQTGNGEVDNEMIQAMKAANVFAGTSLPANNGLYQSQLNDTGSLDVVSGHPFNKSSELGMNSHASMLMQDLYNQQNCEPDMTFQQL